MGRKIAVIGGGISGIACSWGLRKTSYEVDLFEASEKLGGHANTTTFDLCGDKYPVDTGFIVFHPETYPSSNVLALICISGLTESEANFSAFLKTLGVAVDPTDMSFGVSKDYGRFEWSSHSFWNSLLRLENICQLSFWRMILDILRFNYMASRLAQRMKKAREKFGTRRDAVETISIGDFLKGEGYSERFIDDFLVPMVASPWCTDPIEFSKTFPAAKLIEFMYDHGLLETHKETLRWNTIRGGSRSYIQAFRNTTPKHHHNLEGRPVSHVERLDSGLVRVTLRDGSNFDYDHVVLAVHANQALKMLGSHASPTEKAVLENFRTSRNRCVLHSDDKLLPTSSQSRSAWNCLLAQPKSCGTNNKNERSDIIGQKKLSDPAFEVEGSKISLTFDMNRIQHVPLYGATGKLQRALVSMNPIFPPDAHTVQSEFLYDHPIIDANALIAARALPEINGRDRISFAGAWQDCGFHEDGFVSGLAVANSLLPPRTERIPILEKRRPQNQAWEANVMSNLRRLSKQWWPKEAVWFALPCMIAAFAFL